MNDKKRMIHGCHVNESQYWMMHDIQTLHEKRCEEAFDIYGEFCDMSQKEVDNMWKEIQLENARKPNHSEANKKLLEYIDNRIHKLQRESYRSVMNTKMNRREMVHRQLKGRILELVFLKKIITNGIYDKV